MNIFIETMGCSKNLVDSEIMVGLLTDGDYYVVSDPSKADVIIVNTCGFIESAKEESIEMIFSLLEYKKIGSCKKFIVSGCLSERYADELYEEIPEVDAFLGTTTFQEIVNVVKQLFQEDNRKKYIGNIDVAIDENIAHKRFTKNHFAYVKIAEGCDNKCTYCIIPKLRGKYRSRKKEDIIEEVKNLVNQGTKEIILIAQDTARYGIDLYGSYELASLLSDLKNIEDLKWIRIQYAYPDVIDEKLISEIKTNDKVVKYLDIPIQHASDRILKKMNRHITSNEVVDLVNKLRKNIPNMTIRTTLIVGFPGETNEDFKILYDFIKKMKFDKVGVFEYSDEEDTGAYKFKDKVSKELMEKRKKEIMLLQQEISQEANSKKVGETYFVIIDEKLEGENIYLGRTSYDSPEIDGIVYVHTDKKLSTGEFVSVEVTDALEYDLIGEQI